MRLPQRKTVKNGGNVKKRLAKTCRGCRRSIMIYVQRQRRQRRRRKRGETTRGYSQLYKVSLKESREKERRHCSNQ